MINRRHFLAESTLLAGAGVLAGARALAQEPVPAVAEPFKLLCAPVLTHPAPDAVTVLWAASAPATGWVEFGETPELGQRATGSRDGLLPYDERCFKVRLPGLKPGTR